MTPKLSNNNIVIIANNFNPSILREHWLIEKGILTNGEIIGDFTFSNQAVNYRTKDYVLTALANQIQIQIIGGNPSEIISKTLLKVTNLLPHVPYIAVGINFNWELFPQLDETDQKLSEKLFYSNQVPAFSSLYSENSFFGAYVSKDFHLGRMKLDMKPSMRQTLPNSNTERFINFAFNYHHDVRQDATINNILIDWQLYYNNSETVMKNILDELRNK